MSGAKPGPPTANLRCSPRPCRRDDLQKQLDQRTRSADEARSELARGARNSRTRPTEVLKVSSTSPGDLRSGVSNHPQKMRSVSAMLKFGILLLYAEEESFRQSCDAWRPRPNGCEFRTRNHAWRKEGQDRWDARRRTVKAMTHSTSPTTGRSASCATTFVPISSGGAARSCACRCSRDGELIGAIVFYKT